MKNIIQTCHYLVLAAGIFAAAGCQHNRPAPSESSPKEKAVDAAQDGDEISATERGEDLPDVSEDASHQGDAKEQELPRFIFAGTPYEEELHRLKITAADTIQLPLHAEPKESSQIIDAFQLHEGVEIKWSGESRIVITPELRPAPRSFTLSPDSYVSGTEPQGEVKVSQGDAFAIAGAYEGEGTYSCSVWYKGSTYAECPEWSYIFPNAAVERSGQDTPRLEIGDFKGKANGWWIEIEGPKAKGWLRADRDAITAEGVMVGDTQ